MLVLTDAADTLSGFVGVESGAYCKPNDPKRPGKVGIPILGLAPVICPIDGSDAPLLTDAFPDGWYVRIMFDELLDPNVETLIPVLDAQGNETDMFNGSLAETQPVILQCQDVNRNFVDVAYDGYYSPSGNAVSWPLGPSLVVIPRAPKTVPVESECRVTVKESVKDKDGESVPSDQRVARSFKIAPITVVEDFQSPHDGDTIDPAVGGMDMTFNVRVFTAAAPAGPLPCVNATNPACFAFQPAAMAANQGLATYVPSQGCPNDLCFFPFADLLDGMEYTFTTPDPLVLRDKCGVSSTVKGTHPMIKFKTNPFKFTSITPAGGSAVAAAKKISVTFNQLVDPASFEEGVDWTLSPMPPGGVTVGGSGLGPNVIELYATYNVNTPYVFTVKQGAKVRDAFNTKDVTFDAAQVINFTTAPIAITAQSPAENARVAKSATGVVNITLTFNQEILASSLDATEFTLTKADGTPSGITPSIVGVADGLGHVIGLRVSTTGLAAGSYTYTLKMGATIQDNVTPPNTYTQAADRVIHFTVADAAPPAPAFKCLGQP